MKMNTVYAIQISRNYLFIPGGFDEFGRGLEELEEAFLLHLSVLKLVLVHTNRENIGK
jgi:hypothetical protein